MVWLMDSPFSTADADDVLLFGQGLTDDDRIDLARHATKPDIFHGFTRDAVLINEVVNRTKGGDIASALTRPPTTKRAETFNGDDWGSGHPLLQPDEPLGLQPYKRAKLMTNPSEPALKKDDDDASSVVLPTLAVKPRSGAGDAGVVAAAVQPTRRQEPQRPPRRVQEEEEQDVSMTESSSDGDSSIPEPFNADHLPPRQTTIRFQEEEALAVTPVRSLQNVRAIVTHQTTGCLFATFHDAETDCQRRVVVDYDHLVERDGTPMEMGTEQDLKYAILRVDGVAFPDNQHEVVDGLVFDFISENAVFTGEWIPKRDEYEEICAMMRNY